MILYSECKSALKCSSILSQTASVYFYLLRKREKSSNLQIGIQGGKQRA